MVSPHVTLSTCQFLLLSPTDTSVTVFEHNTPKPVTQEQQRAADSSLHSHVLSGVAHGGEYSLLAEGEREG